MAQRSHHIRVKRVYEAPAADDGQRFLVDRLWPRGVRRDALQFDGWLKELAPSDELRKSFGHDPEHWDEFRRRYFAELAEQRQAVAELVAAADRGPVTLLFAARDEQRNNAVALREYLLRGGRRNASVKRRPAAARKAKRKKK